MAESKLPSDPNWPRSSDWLVPAAEPTTAHGDLAVIGVPAHTTSISPSNAHTTPAAVREALSHYSAFAASSGVDLSSLRAIDLGDVENPDGPEGEARVTATARSAAQRFPFVLGIGGDNSITYSLMRGLAADALEDWGLITLDAHHDLRDGITNGSPVCRLVEAGLPGPHVVQIGIADFSNSAFYVERAHDFGITVIAREALRQHSPLEITAQALEIAGYCGRPIFVDLDVDVCDRSVAPGCPASAPGGISADELRQITRLLARDSRVRGVDITEVDAKADTPDGRTVRLAALLVLEVAAGLAQRGEHAG